ncbi:hypothetical protein SAMN02745163_02084 [Clostridium cavendishii DSM 21758]|uniref:Uncharacterized protein n=1 Tax=Clostridium cavendishii DSM 21758 TaxID=1121302 RepID=A0A1M6K397_9CLOT|nr:hypothetical protein [Clostridium cavendishii]SHJ53365.1 hypothetical protein SAMN02745163_02084 [Clostridium cavendishii DSM 21758]
MEIKSGDLMYYFNIELDETGLVKTIVKTYPIIATKEKFEDNQIMVIDNLNYTTLQTKDEKYSTHTIFNKVRCYEMNYHSRGLKDSVTGYLYTTNSNKKVAITKIKKAMEKYLKDKYGKYGNFIELLNKIEA